MRFVSIVLAIIICLSVVSSTWAIDHNDSLSIAQLDRTGLSVKASPYSVEETTSRLINIIETKGLTLFATIDHSNNADTVDLELPSTTLVMFGNPSIGTPLMQCSQSIGIELPQKVLIWQTEQGTLMAYNNPHYLAGRHRLNDCGQSFIRQISNALDNLTNQAIAPISTP